MFSNVGKSIKHIAVVTFALEVVASILTAVIMLILALCSIENFWFLIPLAPISAMIGCVSAWIYCLLLYGFGQLIDDVQAIRGVSGAPEEANIFSREKIKKEAAATHSHYKKLDKKTEIPPQDIEKQKSDANTNQPIASSNICKCGARFYGDTCPSCGRTLEQKERELKTEKAAEKKANVAEQRENAKMQKRIDKYTSKHKIKNLQPQEESVSKICECGERFYGKTCPICGRTIKKN